MMQNTVGDHKRIAKNTIMLYVRMLFSMIVSLYTTRVILSTLGVSDYGIYNVVGGVVGMMSIVTSLLIQGTSRFITIALGRNNLGDLKNVFSASILIHLIFASVIFIIGETIGPWVISRLNIDASRMGAAQFVYQFSLISVLISIILSPFHSSIVAHEKLVVYAYISICDVLAKLAIVYLLTLIQFDKLKLYSLLLFIVGGITSTMYVVYCRRHFVECKSIVLKPDKNLYRDILNYTGWNAIGAVAFAMNNQGITILLNTFGTAVNAARGLTSSVSSVVYKFVDNFQTAAKPQIVKLCAVGDYDGMNHLIIKVSKFSSYLMGLIGIPLFLEMEYVLHLWLTDVPNYTVVFARLTLIQGFIQAIDLPIGAGIHAVGKMKLPNITTAFIYMLILPISYVAIRMGASPEIAYIMIISVYPIALVVDLIIITKYTSFPMSFFLKNVVLRSVLFVILVFIIVKFITIHMLIPAFIRLIITTIVSSICFATIVYFCGITLSERNFINNLIFGRLKLGKNKFD